MSQMLTRIAMTFQSTNLKAWSSVMAPIMTMSTTPTMAATTLSIQRTMTIRMVARKTTRVSV